MLALRVASWFLSLLLGFLVLTGPAYSALARGFDAAQTAALGGTLDMLIDKYSVPGAIMAIKDPQGNVAHFNAGLADIATGQKMSSDLYSHIGSATKTFTATVILQLVDQGKVSLDSTVEEWLPGQVNGGENVTLTNLLQMRSGLGHVEAQDAYFAILYGDSQYDFKLSELISYANMTAPTEPDQSYDYNNLNYFILGAVIEEATGKSYQQAITDMILNPLGLTNTSVPTTSAIPEPYAHGYLNQYIVDPSLPRKVLDVSTTFSVSSFGAAGSMISKADDMLAWLDVLLSGELLSQASHDHQLELIPANDGRDVAYGLGVSEYNGAVGHNGNYNDFYSSVNYRYQGYDFALLCNGGTLSASHNSNAQSIFDDLKTIVNP